MSKKYRKRFKIMMFRLITYLPLFILVFIIFQFGVSIHKTKTVEQEKVYSTLNNYLENGKNMFNIPHYLSTEVYYDFERYLQSGGLHKNNFLIYSYGGSSIVIPGGSSGNHTFTFYLERRLNKENNKSYKIINWGATGIDSHIIKNIILNSISIKKPNLIVVYTGHNDYTNAYRRFIKPNYYIFKGNLIEKLLTWILDDEKSYKFFEFKLEPTLIKLFQKIKLINLDNHTFQAYNNLILKHYSENILEMIELSRKEKIPIVFITPIGNLEAEPFGVNGATNRYYVLGMNQNNYSKRIDYLIKAKDSESFSYDMRAKSDLNNFLRNLTTKGVYVLDIETEFLKERFSFSNNDFYDYFHFFSTYA